MTELWPSRSSTPGPSRTPRCRRSCSACGSTETDGGTVHALALRCQIRIEPQRRRYQPEEEDRLYELFGETPRWGDSLRPFLWTHVSTTIAGFTGSTEFDLPVECTYDFEVAGGQVPARPGRTGRFRCCCCSPGTVFTRGEAGFAAEPVSWDLEASYRLPVVGVAGRDGPVLPEQRLAAGRPRHPRPAPALQGRRGPLPTWDQAFEHLSSRPGRTDREHGRAPTGSPRPGRSPTPCSTRATSSTRTGRRRRKNQVRWQFGVLTPRAFSEADGSERWCDAHRVPRRSRVRPRAGGPDPLPAGPAPQSWRGLGRRTASFVPVDGFEVDGAVYVDWDEAVDQVVDLPAAPLCGADGGGHERRLPASPAASDDRDDPTPPTGRVAGRIVRRREPVDGRVRGRRPTPAGRSGPLIKVAVTVENTTRVGRAGHRRRRRHRPFAASPSTPCWPSTTAPFVSLLDPPDGRRAGGGRLPQRRDLPRPDRRRRRRAVVADHPLRPPRGGAREPRRPLRRHRDRRDPRPAGADPHRRGEVRGPGHRPPRRPPSSTAATTCPRRCGSACTGPCASSATHGSPCGTSEPWPAADGRSRCRGGTRRSDASVDPWTDSVRDRGRRRRARAPRSGCGPRTGPTPRTSSWTA